MHHRHTLIESLAQDRHAARYARPGEARPGEVHPDAAARSALHVERQPGPLAATRRRTGWLLVAIGLRLAVPRQRDRDRAGAGAGAVRRIRLLG